MPVRMWCAVLLALSALAGPAAADIPGVESILSNISNTLRSETANETKMAVDENSKPPTNTTYVSSFDFDMGAMGPLYNLTGLIIEVIANKQAYPEGIVSVSAEHMEFASLKENWRVLLRHYAGPVAFVVVAVLLVVAFLLSGLIWCCWCRSDRRRHTFDRSKTDARPKGLFAIVLIALLTLFLFGVVCAFATDDQFERGASEVPNAIRAGVSDAGVYLNATMAQLRWLLVTNYGELAKKLEAVTSIPGATISSLLGKFSRAVSVTTLDNMVQRLDAVQADLRSVHNITSMLRSNAELLNSGLHKVKAQLLQTLAKCEQPQCIKLQEKYKIGQLNTQIHYNQIADVAELLNNVTGLLDSNIKADVEEGQQVFANIQTGIQRSTGIKEVLAKNGRKLEDAVDQLAMMANNASAKFQEHGSRVADTMQEYYEKYGRYRRHASRATAAGLLLITCVLAWGLVCVVCGKRPGARGASVCYNKGAGARYFLCGMCVMFIVGGFSSLVMAVYFVVGVGSQRFLCDPLTEPRGNRLFFDLDRYVDLEYKLFKERRDPNFNLSHVLTYCHQNRSILETLQLQRLLKLDLLKAQVVLAVKRRASSLKPTFSEHDRPVTILKPSVRLKLTRLADSGLSDFDFDRILHALETNMTNLSLDILAAQLEATASSLYDRPGFVHVSNELHDAAVMLNAYHGNIVTPMLDHTRQLNIRATRLRDGLRFNHSSLKEAIGSLIHETSQAETFLNRRGFEFIQTFIQDFAAMVAKRLYDYLEVDLEAGACAPLSNVFNATRDAICKKMLMPVNGYWVSMAWCVLLLTPLLVVAQLLARLYRHVDRNPGPCVEAYVFDDVSVELAMALLQLLAGTPVEEFLFRAVAALARLAHHSAEVGQLVALVGPPPTTFRGTSLRCDEKIDLIMQKVK